jgi:zinc transport system permease protein
LVTGIDPVLTGSIFSVLTAMGVGYVSRAGKMSADTVIGIFYAAGMALGIALISVFKGYYPELFSLLFGNILSVSFRDLLLMGIVLLLALAFIVLFFKELLAICFDEEMAEAGGLPVGPLYMVLLAVIGLTVIVSIQLVGIVLVAALIVIPGAAALRISKNYRGMLALSLFFGLVGSIGGLVLSYFYPVPPGAAIVLILTLLFILTLVLNFSLEKKLQRRGSFE